MLETFDPNKINFDIESNELAMRLANLKRTMKELNEPSSLNDQAKLEVLINLQAEATHIETIFNTGVFKKTN